MLRKNVVLQELREDSVLEGWRVSARMISDVNVAIVMDMKQ